jgi:hypothetical protein
VLVRTGQLTRVLRAIAEGKGWGAYAGGPAPGLSFETAGWLHGCEIAAIATDTWGVEVRPNEWPDAMQPLHQVALPHIGLLLGEMWDLDALAAIAHRTACTSSSSPRSRCRSPGRSARRSIPWR